MWKRKIRSAVLAVLPLLLSACQWMPVEEQLPAPPVLQSYEKPEYTQIAVQRGDIIRTERITCIYKAAKTESHAFFEDGKYYEAVYVSEGQHVKAGELLAELEQDDVDQKITDLQYQLDRLKLQKAHIYENWELEKRLLEAKQGTQAQMEAVDKKYQVQLQNIADSQQIKNLRMEELLTQRKSRQIYAGMDGIVTFALDVKQGDKTVKHQKVVELADMETTFFSAIGDYDTFFPAGTEVTIHRGEDSLTAVVIDGEKMGLPTGTENKKNYYFQPVLPDTSLEDGDRGTISLTLDAAYDVLYLEKRAIHTTDDKPFVYVQDENGFKVKKRITTGLSNDVYTQILSGLEEGQLVILN